jgi:hypothetical protein
MRAPWVQDTSPGLVLAVVGGILLGGGFIMACYIYGHRKT